MNRESKPAGADAGKARDGQEERDGRMTPLALGAAAPGRGWALAARAMAAGLLLTLFQLTLLMVAAPGPREASPWHGREALAARYFQLFQHDSFWFENILQRGYASPVPPVPYKDFAQSNVAFFPGYPVVAGWVARAGNLGTREALLLTAQVGAWLFWSYAVALLLAWRVPFWLGVAGLAAIAAHPAGMFLVAGYSESLFLAALLGFLYWSARPGAVGAGVAALHGFGMTATRIAGIPCALARVAEQAWKAGGWHGAFGVLRRPLCVALVSLLGAASFFAFCQWRFGSWDFYMQTQAAGWGLRPRYLAPFQWALYGEFHPDWRDPRQLGQFSVTVTFWLLAAMLLLERFCWRRAGGRGGWRVRFPYYFSAVAMLYVSVAGVASVHFDSLIRYQFCSHVLLVLAGIHLLREAWPRRGWARALLGLAVVLGALFFSAAGFFVQAHFAREFTKGGWFA